jgi:ABC-type branched-subunit amino acid transport system permease subunit
VHSGEFCDLEAVMEADIEFVTVICALTFAMVFIVLGLSVMAGTIYMFKFAHGAFGLLGPYTLYPVHERGLPLWGVIFCAAVRAGARRLPARGDQYPPLQCQSDHRVLSALVTTRRQLPKPQ